MFVGMVVGGVQMRLLMGLPSELDSSDLKARAEEAARRFIKAYAREG
jgi:hypothetical protein